jgi:hypothetical protein
MTEYSVLLNKIAIKRLFITAYTAKQPSEKMPSPSKILLKIFSNHPHISVDATSQ